MCKCYMGWDILASSRKSLGVPGSAVDIFRFISRLKLSKINIQFYVCLLLSAILSYHIRLYTVFLSCRLVYNKYVQFQLSTENNSLRMDYQVRNMPECRVSHKNFNHILNFNVVFKKTNLVIFCTVHWSVNKK
jgi:hypothetical protein